MTVALSFEDVPGPAKAERRAVFLHGILGSGPNLRSLARRFVEARPGWDAWLVDLRGHGSSPKGTPAPSLEAAAADVAELCASSLPVAAVIGHSFGGKVALELLRQGCSPTLSTNQRLLGALSHVVTLDSNPGPREPLRGGDSALAVLEMLQALPAVFPSRAAFIQAVLAAGKSRMLAQWLAMSTAPVATGGVRFALDFAEIHGLLMSYFAADLWPVVQSPPASTYVHLVIGERSTSYSPADRARARAIASDNQRVTVDVLPTDHWVHTEDPDGLLAVLLARIPR